MAVARNQPTRSLSALGNSMIAQTCENRCREATVNTDRQATWAGAVLAGLNAVTVDYAKVAAGDRTEIARLAFSVVIALLGWVANKH
jgi:hypothetical protein